jgi:hypothetical protein
MARAPVREVYALDFLRALPATLVAAFSAVRLLPQTIGRQGRHNQPSHGETFQLEKRMDDSRRRHNNRGTNTRERECFQVISYGLKRLEE